MGELFRFLTALREVPSITTYDTGHPQSNAYGFPPVEPIWTPPLVDVSGDLEGIPGQDEQPVGPPTSAPPERYALRVWIDGYRIYDRGQLIVTVHGPQAALAWKIYCALRDDTNGES